MSEWINVKDTLPEDGIEVLVVDFYNQIYLAFYKKTDGWSVYEGGFWPEIYTPKFWIPLPKPPRENS